jgi:ribonuclease HII
MPEPRPPRKQRLNLVELRARFAAGRGAEPSSQLLASLKLDPRPGAQSLWRTLKRRRETVRDRELRLASLLNFERVLWKAGVRHVAGVDEVGIGPLAGPVVAAAVILPPDIDLAGVDDSKKLDPATRARLDREIRARALAVSVAEVEVGEVDRLNVYRAGLEAMRRAVLALEPRAEHVLTDAREIPGLGSTPQNAFDKGDGLDYSIACASIVAKVHRDRRMEELALLHPGFGFERHKGYGTAEHLAAIRRLGLCPIHRRSFPVLGQILGQAGPLFDELKGALDAARSLGELLALRARIRAARASGLADPEARKLATLLARRSRRLAG